MANDKLFHKRKAAAAATKKSLARRNPNRNPRKRALIVCEDSVSAPAYFKKLIGYLQLNTIDVQICGESESAPISVVRFGEAYLQQDKDFEYIFFVFDRDMHDSYGAALEKIHGLQKRKEYRSRSVRIQAITSVPCFELWLFLHYKNSSKPWSSTQRHSPASCLIAELRKLGPPFKDYRKDRGCAYFDAIKDKLHVAIKHAEALLENSNYEEDTHYINPSTRVHQLVKTLQEIAASY